MISYFDTSALIPLIIDEPASATCARLWDEAARTISSRLIYPEARAALAQAQRSRRLSVRALVDAVEELDSLALEIDHLEVSADVARSAGVLAQAHALRGYDAVHLASARLAIDDELVFVTGDHDLGAAATSIGMAVAVTTT